YVISPPSRAHYEGRFAIVTIRWAWDAVGRCGVRRFTCRTKRRGGRRSRVVLAPRPWRLSPPACAGVATVTIKAAHRGEPEVSRKTIARGKPGCLGCTCQIRVHSHFSSAHGDAGASGARLSLRPLFQEGQRNGKAQVYQRRERAPLCFLVIASDLSAEAR